MKRTLLFISILTSSFCGAQEKKDSTKVLDQIIIKGYESNVSLLKVPASISTINKTSLSSTSNYSLLPAINNITGVKMEERSPGSYRLSIRGSLLRSPFGVRNIKIYYDDFILTDAGGNTYFNLLDIHSINSMELIKGPAGSLYGAGTGGAVLLNGFSTWKDSSALTVRLNGGSFGTFNESVQYQQNKKGLSLNLVQGHFQSKGYRVQSGMRKDYIQLNTRVKSSDNSSTDFLLLYADLNYQTPGGLTLAQYTANPRQARPATPTLPSVLDQKTAIFNKTALIGVSNTYNISKNWKTVSSITNSLTWFKNPFITNFEKRKEINLGLRSKIVYENSLPISFQWVTGFEVQKGDYTIDSSGNAKGVSDGKTVTDVVVAQQRFAFTQLNIQPVKYFLLQAGLSMNRFNYSIQRTLGLPTRGKQTLDFNRQVLPRVAAVVMPIESISFFSQISKGYSSPSIAEIRPSAGGVYTGLQAEYGWNKELGVKMSALRNKLYFTATVFQFDLRDAIVRRVNSAGAEYFMNQGDVKQKGIEIEYRYTMANLPKNSFIRSLGWAQSLTINDYRFINYKNNLTSFAGNKLTGVPDKMVASNLSIDFVKGFYLNLQFNYVGKSPLNDANTVYGNAYRLWQSRCGWKSNSRKLPVELFFLLDNIGNEKYSLGYDINAFGNRFYNASPTRNVQGGVVINL